MGFEIVAGEKFAALVLVRASAGRFDTPLDLGGGLWATSSPPVDIGTIWREWVGSIASRRIEEGNLWLIARRPSAAPEILDQENRDLKDDVWHLFLGLLLLGTPSYEGGYLLTGAHVHGAPDVRQYSEIQQYYLFHRDQHLSVGERELRAAGPMREGLRAVYADPQYMRVRRGISVFWKGLERQAAIARLHEFVRAVEAVVKPAPPGIKKKMIERSQTFTGRSASAVSAIGEAYELRSKEEHLLEWEDALAHVPVGCREGTLYKRLHQAEALARHIYERVLTSRPHLAYFQDASIDAFWNLPEADRVKRWDTVFDIDSVA